MKAVWNGRTIAQSDATVEVEGNHYFPPDAVERSCLAASDTTSYCPWKGTASYCHVVVDGETNPDAAWFYPQTSAEATHFKDYIAFWRGVEVVPG